MIVKTANHLNIQSIIERYGSDGRGRGRLEKKVNYRNFEAFVRDIDSRDFFWQIEG